MSEPRTREGRRQEILAQVRKCGGFSVFWVTANQVRAGVATDMFRFGELANDGDGGQFPWHRLRIVEKP